MEAMRWGDMGVMIARGDLAVELGFERLAEVTDAAMGRRAEAVMLDKGPFIVEASETLASILDRIGGHVEKKRSLLRPLASFDL